MAIRIDYLARETSSNLVRNFSITLASILTVFVSLTLVGTSLMAKQGVDRATRRWQGGIEFIIFMKPTASDEQIRGLQTELDSNPAVEKPVAFVNQQQAYEEFQELFSDSPEMIDSVRPDVLPTSFRVEPVDKGADTISALSESYKDRAGVKEVVSATDTIRLIQRFSEFLTGIILAVAFALLLTALLLIFNTIRMAMFARRREIEVMKLVGATNWFIRVPYMAEGLIQGLLGAIVSIAGLMIFRPIFEGWLPPADQFPIFSGFVPAGPDMLPIYLLLAVVGCLVGATGAGVAVTRFLDV
jgi:cell division transport system permease protein